MGLWSCDSKAGCNAGSRIPNLAFAELVQQCGAMPAVTRRGIQVSRKGVVSWFARGQQMLVNETLTQNVKKKKKFCATEVGSDSGVVFQTEEMYLQRFQT